jgi:FdhE protein
MSPNHISSLPSPEENAAGQQAPYLHLPNRLKLFSERETRLRQLAASHPMRDFLLFIAELSRAQHTLLQSYPAVPLPGTSLLDAASRAAKRPLPAALWPRDPQWRIELWRMLDALLPRLAGSPAQSAVHTLLQMTDEELEQQAGHLLRGELADLDMAAAPLIGAGLQVYWTHMVLATQEAHGAGREPPFGRAVDAGLCPFCASRPTVSVSGLDASGANHRYLHCSLCSAQWHMAHIKCSHCESTKGIHYQSLQPAAADSETPFNNAVEAETCDACRHYLKIVRTECDGSVEPVADDLARFTLDLLVSEAGFECHGVNLMRLLAPQSEP